MNRSFKLIVLIISSFIFLALCLGVLTRLQLMRVSRPVVVDIDALKPKVAARFLPLDNGVGEVLFADAKMAFHSKEAVFVDARHLDSFRRARIPGAISLYWRDYLVASSVLDRYTKNQLFIVYCSSSQCDMARRTADLMFGNGFHRVYVLKDGIQDWAAQQGNLESDYVSF